MDIYGSAKDFATLTSNRAIALYHLRVNPKNRKQISMVLEDENGDRCALGLIAEAFGIPCRVDAIDAYARVGDIINHNFSLIYQLNDHHHKTFREIADYLAAEWGME